VAEIPSELEDIDAADARKLGRQL